MMNHKIIVGTIYDYVSLTLSLGPSDDCFENLLSYMIDISGNMNVFRPPMLAIT